MDYFVLVFFAFTNSPNIWKNLSLYASDSIFHTPFLMDEVFFVLVFIAFTNSPNIWKNLSLCGNTTVFKNDTFCVSE